jgi:phosphoglycolate phosphatase
MLYKHIIWDWNGTLFDDAWLCAEIMNGLLGQRNLPVLTLERYQQIFDFPVINYYRKAGFDFSIEPFEMLSNTFIAEYERRNIECGLRPEARPVLRQMVARGVGQSILSASKQTLLESMIDHCQVREWFEAINGVDNYHALGKVDLGRRWVTQLDIEPSEVLLIGDTVHDHEVAQAMGVACWLIHSGHQDRARLAVRGVRVIESLSELLGE